MKNMTLGIATFCHSYTKCWVSLLMSMRVIMPSVLMLSVIMLIVIMLSVIMLSVAASKDLVCLMRLSLSLSLFSFP